MRVCFFPANFEGAGFYRCGLPLRELNKVGFVCGVPPYRMNADRSEIYLDFRLSRPSFERGVVESATAVPAADVFVWQMAQHEPAVRVARAIRSKGFPVVAELDDNLLDLPTWHPAFKNRNPQFNRDHWHGLVREADLVTVSTEFLAERYSTLNANVRVLPNYLDREMWDVPMAYDTERRRVRVGWMGSSEIRTGDLRVLQGVIGPWLRRHPEVEFVAAGDPRVHDILDVPHGQRVSCARVPFQRDDVYHLPDITAVMDIGLVPLELHPFNEGKSWLKGMEYAAAGIPCIASPTGSYRFWVDEGHNGFLAKKPADWLRHLDTLVSDDGLRRQMGRNARAKVEQHWFQDHVDEWADTYKGVVGAESACAAA